MQRHPSVQDPAGGAHFIGLDVHKRVVQACVLDASGHLLREARFDCTALNLRAFARDQLVANSQAALEATCHTWAIVEALAEGAAPGVPIVVSNPMRTRAIASAKVKTDRIDARVLADLLRCDYLPRVWQPDAATRTQRRRSSHRAALVAQRTACKNRLHALLTQRLIVCPHADLFGNQGLQWLQQLDLDAEAALVRQAELAILATLQAQLQLLHDAQAHSAWDDPRVKLLMTLPGVDMTVAQTLLAAWGDIARFDCAERASAYLGLAPSTHASANKCYHGAITKHGNSRARWLLVQAAQHLDKHPGPLGVQFKRLTARKNRNIAVVAMARKLACIAYLMLQRNEPYRYALPVPTQNKLARLRVAATGVRRKTGPAVGTPRSATHGAPRRTTPALSNVLTKEALPALVPLAPGELHMLDRLGLAHLPSHLDSPSSRPRRRSPPDPAC